MRRRRLLRRGAGIGTVDLAEVAGCTGGGDGPEPPETEEDFPQPGLNTTDLGQTPHRGLRDALWLADGWREYSFEWITPELSTDTHHLAVGTAVIWEADAIHYVDDLAVTAEQR